MGLKKNVKYKKVLLRECKRHTTCRIASTHCAGLSLGRGYLPWMGGVPTLRGYLPRTRVGTPPPSKVVRYPTSKVGTPPTSRVGTSIQGRYPSSKEGIPGQGRYPIQGRYPPPR